MPNTHSNNQYRKKHQTAVSGNIYSAQQRGGLHSTSKTILDADKCFDFRFRMRKTNELHEQSM